MIALRLDTEYLEIDASLSLAIHNPLFDPNASEALYSYPFKFLATPTNLHVLDHANRLDNADNTTTYTNAVLELDGLPFEYGVLQLDDQPFTAEYISAVFTNAVPSLMEELEKINIHEILETVSSSDTPPPAVWVFEVAPPDADYAMQIDGLQAIIPAIESDPLTHAEVIALLVSRINDDHPGIATVATFPTFTLDAEMVELYPVEIYSASLTLVSITTPAQSKYQGFLNHVTETNWNPIASHCWPVIYWPGFYKQRVLPIFWSYVNPWLDGIHLENTPRATQEWEATYVPFVYITYVLQRIADTLPAFVGSWGGYVVEDADLSQLIIFNNRALDFLEENQYDVGERLWLNRFQEEIDLNRHVPEMTAKDFLLKLCEGLGAYFRYDGANITFHKKVLQTTTTPLNITSLAEPAAVATRRRRRGYKLRYPPITEDQRLLTADLDQLLPRTSGEGWNTYDMPFHSCRMISAGYFPFTDRVKFPIVQQPGSSNEGGLGDNPYSFRLLFFRGLSLSEAGDNYVMASNDATNYHGDPNGSLSLDLIAADGIYEQLLKGIPELIADGQTLTLPVRLAIHDIITLRKWEDARRTITLPTGQVTAIIKSVKFKVDSAGLGISLVEFVQEK
jgi:hypothetical protein